MRETIVRTEHLILIASCTTLGVLSLESSDYFWRLALEEIQRGWEGPSIRMFALMVIPVSVGVLSLFLSAGFAFYLYDRIIIKEGAQTKNLNTLEVKTESKGDGELNGDDTGATG